jgi:cellobiose phosphorylase
MSLEIWRLNLRNISNRNAKSAPLTMWNWFWDAVTDQSNLDWGMHILHSHHENGVLITTTQFRQTFTYFTSNQLPVGFDSDREAFIGRYRDLSSPIVVEIGQPRHTEAPRGNNIASLCHDLELAPGEAKEVIYILGVMDSPTLSTKQANSRISRYPITWIKLFKS